jgi:Fe-Mn family superoxide dismutase
MHLHHDKHLQTYVNNLNAALKDYPQFQTWSLEQLLYYSDRLPEQIRTAAINNGGGVYNHNFYFANLSPAQQQNASSGDLLDAINNSFGSVDAFKDEFKKQALAVFGSGYTWLVINPDGNLEIINTKNQDTVLPLNACPIMGIDVWEHAYYLKHYNLRADYIDDWFKIVNWPQAKSNYMRCISLTIR